MASVSASAGKRRVSGVLRSRATSSPRTFPHFSAQRAVSTRCGLTAAGTHDRLRPSFTPARTQLPHQAVASPTIVLCPRPHPPRPRSRQTPCCWSCETRAPTSRAWSRRCLAISSRNSWYPSRAWMPGSGVSPRSGGRSAAGWPSGEFRSTGSSGDARPGQGCIRAPLVILSTIFLSSRSARPTTFISSGRRRFTVSRLAASWPVLNMSSM